MSVALKKVESSTEVQFPAQSYSNAADYAGDYFEALYRASKEVDLKQIAYLADILDAAIQEDKGMFICGNGGSAAIANHALCDMVKCVCSDTGLKPRIQSLSAHTELLSALSNDIGYEDVFAYQIETFGREGDVLMTVSSSGNSPNVVKAIHAARKVGMKTIAFTGFMGGESSKVADVNIHVPAQNYGLSEDVHMSVIHIVAQFIRMKRLQGTTFDQVKF